MYNNMDLKGKKMKSEKCLNGHLEMVAHIFSCRTNQGMKQNTTYCLCPLAFKIQLDSTSIKYSLRKTSLEEFFATSKRTLNRQLKVITSD